jgi:hypothetical protein
VRKQVEDYVAGGVRRRAVLSLVPAPGTDLLTAVRRARAGGRRRNEEGSWS